MSPIALSFLYCVLRIQPRVEDVGSAAAVVAGWATHLRVATDHEGGMCCQKLGCEFFEEHRSGLLATKLLPNPGQRAVISEALAQRLQRLALLQ